MNKTLRTITLMISLSILFTNILINPTQVSAAGLRGSNGFHKIEPVYSPTNKSTQPGSAASPSCSNPTPRWVSICRDLERQILASTVRLLMFTPLMQVKGSGYRILSGMGHATVKDGRYLVTHNHFDEVLTAMLRDGDPDNLITVNIFNTNGDLISQVPGRTLKVLKVDHETIVFDLGKKNGIGFFTALGLPSAKFLARSSTALKSGMEVAQIDWNGTSSHVDWVTIKDVTKRSGTSVIKLANCIKKGASGGGIFLQGSHIGNNWSRTEKCDQGSTVDHTAQTTVALNSQLVIAP